MTQYTLLTTLSKSEPWLEAAHALYSKKLKAFAPFALDLVKDKSGSVDERILKRLGDQDHTILLDEAGQQFQSSLDFARHFQKIHDCSFQRVTFVIGGPFGVGEALRTRCRETWTLGSLTMSHMVAQVVFLEQFYRAWTIIKNLPYHNEGRLESPGRRTRRTR